MSKPGFYNDNLNRVYPFIPSSAGRDVPDTGPLAGMFQLPDQFVADCGFTVAGSAIFDPTVHLIYLHEVRRPGADVVEFEFRSTDPTLAAYPLVFSRSSGDTLRTYFVESPIPYSSETQDDPFFPTYQPCGQPYWYGYAVFGDIQFVFDRLAIGESLTRSDPAQSIVMPTLITNTSGGRLTSINVGNKDRTRATVPAGCTPYVWDFPTNETYVVAQCIPGNIRLLSGYNLVISQSPTTGALTLTPTLNGGEGPPCDEVPLFPGETPPVDHTNNRFSGDFLCNEVFRTVNGIPGPDFNLLPGSGVSIISDPGANTVIVDVNLNGLAVCSSPAVVDVSESV